MNVRFCIWSTFKQDNQIVVDKTESFPNVLNLIWDWFISCVNAVCSCNHKTFFFFCETLTCPHWVVELVQSGRVGVCNKWRISLTKWLSRKRTCSFDGNEGLLSETHWANGAGQSSVTAVCEQSDASGPSGCVSMEVLLTKWRLHRPF